MTFLRYNLFYQQQIEKTSWRDIMNKQYKGRIVEIEKYQNRATYIKQGVKGVDQYKYDDYSGGNGTYVTGGEYFGTSLDIKVYVYDIDCCIKFDVYEDVLRYTGNKKISAQMLEKIERHKGEKVDLTSDDERKFYFNIRQIID